MSRSSGAAGRSSPHDALFRRILGEPEHAASELRSVLPPALAARLELDRLIPVPGSFVDDALRWRHCDLLFTTRSRGRAAYVYVLMEHQSSPDPWMAWRMLRYVTRIWDRHRAVYPEATQLPLVVPLVVYHGSSPWRYPTDLGELLDVDVDLAAEPGVAAVLPRFGFLLDDLSRVDEASLRARVLTPPARVTLLLLARAAGNPRLAGELAAWVGELRAVLDRPDGTETFRALVTYIQLVGEPPNEDLQQLMGHVGSDAEEAYVSIADMLRAEGKAEGKAEGEAEGKALGRAEALLQLLALRFGASTETTVATVRAAPVEQIEAWTARVLNATTIDDVWR